MPKQSAPEAASFHRGLTPERVLDAATGLTREAHLMSWSIRDLASRLGVVPSVIYHHVGGKDMLSRGVVERVVSRVALPPQELHWTTWFRELLYSAGPEMSRYPGVAQWMLLHGPITPSTLPILEMGVRVLHRDGFGSLTNFAYALLLNNAMLTISIGDERLRHGDDGPRDHATMMTEFEALSTGSDEMRAMGQEFIGLFAESAESAAENRDVYFRFVVDTTIAGLERVLEQTSATGAVVLTEQARR